MRKHVCNGGGYKLAITLYDKAHFIEDLSNIASTEQPACALEKIAEKVKDYLHSDGAKIFILERTPKGPGINQLCRTGTGLSENKEHNIPLLSENYGLTDWVIRNNQWLLIPEMQLSTQKHDQSIRVEGFTQDGQYQKLEARPESEFDQSFNDDEESMLFVPIEIKGHPAGALAIWRCETTPTPYEEKDAENLIDIIPYIVSACTRLIQLKDLKKELDEVSSYVSKLHDISNLGEAYISFAKGIGRLTLANHVILLYHDPERFGHIYHCGVWSAESEFSQLSNAFQGYSDTIEFHNKDYQEQIIINLQSYLEERNLTEFTCRKPLLCYPHDERNKLRIIAVLIDQRNNQDVQHLAFFTDDELLKHRAISFIQYAVTLLRHHINSYSQKIAVFMDENGENINDLEPRKVVELATIFLKRALNASAALIYHGPSNDINIVYSTPIVQNIETLNVKSDSLTHRVFENSEPCYIPDITDKSDKYLKYVQFGMIDKLTDAYGWNKMRSLLLCPVIIDNRCIAVIKLITDDTKSFLIKHHKKVCDLSVTHAGLEYQKAIRPHMLNKLNELTTKFASIHTAQDKKDIVLDLQKWIHQFVKPDCEIAIIARNLPEKILFAQHTEGIKNNEFERLSELSKTWGKTEKSLQVNNSILKDGLVKIKLGCLAAPFHLQNEEDFQGHLFVLNKESFSEHEKTVTKECAREISLIMHTEQLTFQWKKAIGRYRHDVIGPVQGLKSAAQALAELAIMDNADQSRNDLINKCKQKIDEEVATISLWRENQRLYMSENIDIHLKINPLKPVFQRCLERFKPLFLSRKIKVHENWMPSGEIRFAFDEQALDLAFTNLLDNAGKYAFYNREVTIGAAIHDYKVSIWVEDIGHQIPERIAKLIYHSDFRIDWKDPVRWIEGEGLGLPMALKIVQAHGGELSHRCEPAGQSIEGNYAPYKVRFTITLPTKWRQSQ